jgi:hypothetical protein
MAFSCLSCSLSPSGETQIILGVHTLTERRKSLVIRHGMRVWSPEAGHLRIDVNKKGGVWVTDGLSIQARKENWKHVV